jgi:ABC-type transport system involved in multi-copper enzyme maturation permease subunit
MTGSFLATWVRLRRRVLLIGTLVAVVLVTALSTTLAFGLADTPPDERPGPQGGAGAAVTVETLTTPSGLLQGLSLSLSLVGIIALCVAAATFAGQYGDGTIRSLLLREPRRLRYLAGAWAAVVSFVVVAVLLSAVVAGALAVASAPGAGVSTDTWFTADGLGESARTVGLVVVSAIGYATLGSALGVLLRAAVPAVVIGFGWLFLVETIVASTSADAGRWLPGQLLTGVATDGGAGTSLSTAFAGSAAYLLLAAGLATLAFWRRDVTA